MGNLLFFKQSYRLTLRNSSISRGERLCKEAAEKIFKVPFQKVRPRFLINPNTGRAMEIDVYNEDLRIGIEYNGKQHYYFTPYFHENNSKFEEQVQRDKLKRKLCVNHGISLIIVPYTIRFENIHDFILEQATNRKLFKSQHCTIL